MPFRYVLRKGGVDHPVGYSLLMLSLGMIVCMLAAVTISVRASDRAIEQNKAQEVAQQKESRRAACIVIMAQDEAFQDPEALPATKAGKKAAEAWSNLRTVFQCDHQE